MGLSLENITLESFVHKLRSDTTFKTSIVDLIKNRNEKSRSVDLAAFVLLFKTVGDLSLIARNLKDDDIKTELLHIAFTNPTFNQSIKTKGDLIVLARDFSKQISIINQYASDNPSLAAILRNPENANLLSRFGLISTSVANNPYLVKAFSFVKENEVQSVSSYSETNVETPRP